MMRSLQTSNQPCGWIFFGRLYFLVVFLFLPQCIHSDGKAECSAMCKKMRPPGHVHPFTFNCEDDPAFWSRDLRNECREKCRGCPKENCDEYINENFWHCPSVKGYSDECRHHCDSHRPKGNPLHYTLKCAKGSSDCDRVCDKCPNIVCDSSKSSSVYQCPREELLKGECKEQCDKVRKHRMVTEFKFKCSEEYKDNDREKQKCQNTCTDKCPAYVCDSTSDPDTYTCPTARFDNPEGSCASLSNDKRREVNDKTLLEFEWNCRNATLKDPRDDTQWRLDCIVVCENNCRNEKYVCDSSDSSKYHVFYFPRIPLPDLEGEPQASPSYKGACKEWCAKSEAGGIHPYPLNCDTTYKSAQEIAECKKVCKECGQDCHGGDTIECKGHEDEVAKLEEIKKKEKSDHDSKLHKITSQRVYSDDSWISVTIAVILLLILAGVIYAIINKRRKRSLNMAAGFPGMVQPQQQQFQMPPPPHVPPLESSTVSMESLSEPERKHKKHREENL